MVRATTPPTRRRTPAVDAVAHLRDGVGGLVVVALLIGIAALAPEPTPFGAARLAALAIAVSGASLLVTRVGAADLATAAAAGAGAYLGGVGIALLGSPILLGLPVGAVAGGMVGAASGALHGRVGRTLGALTSLALGGGVVAAIGAWTDAGGVAGFHAVPLLTRGGARSELILVGVVLVMALAVVRAVAAGRSAAGAAVAVRAPVLAASLGRHPAVDAALIGAAAGGLLGVGGMLLATIDGSVVPAAYGLQLAAALALAALIGGAPPLGPVLGTLLVWGPATVWPLVPIVGTAPPLLVAGPVGLIIMALRRGRPLIPAGTPAELPVGGERSPRAPANRSSLRVLGADTPSGPCHLDVHPGEIVALAGPNGAGKSTLLARIAGQLPDSGRVEFDGRRAPHGAVARARSGVRRTWQRAPVVASADMVALMRGDPASRSAAAWAAATLGVRTRDAGQPPDTGEPRDASAALDVGVPPDIGVQQLILLAASGPAIALLDEPTDVDADRLLVLLRGLAGAGAGVLVVDHRPEVLAGADRIVTLGTDAVTS